MAITLKDQEENVLAYIGGYMIHKQESKKICQDCLQLLSIPLQEAETVEYTLIREKQHSENPNHGLRAPFAALLQMLGEAESAYQQYINSSIHHDNVCDKIINTNIVTAKFYCQNWILPFDCINRSNWSMTIWAMYPTGAAKSYWSSKNYDLRRRG